jgi:hypothetical protein
MSWDSGNAVMWKYDAVSCMKVRPPCQQSPKENGHENVIEDSRYLY